jgi:hypothetical protein
MRSVGVAISGMLMFVTGVLVYGQQDTMRSGSVYFRTIRITGNDTIVEERHYDMGQPGRNAFSFRFGDDIEEGIQGWGGAVPSADSTEKETIERFSGGERIFSDSSRIDLRFSLPGMDLPGFDFRQFTPDLFRMPDGLIGEGRSTARIPAFSVEDVAIYKENNSVRNFRVRPVPGTPILIVEADLDNKRSVYTVYDNRGNTIHSESLRRIEGEFRRILDLTKMESGTYFVKIKNGNSTKKKRITIR